MAGTDGFDAAARLGALEEQLNRIEQKVDRMLGLYDAIGSIAAGLPPRLVFAPARPVFTPPRAIRRRQQRKTPPRRGLSLCLAEWITRPA